MNSVSQQNQLCYDYLESRKKFVDGSPHLKHRVLINYYLSLVKKCCDEVKHGHFDGHAPRVLDLGAGDGTATLSFVVEKCSVTAVDISIGQLTRFKETFPEYAHQCEVVCADAVDYLSKTEKQYDVIVFNSFLHHIPDYLALVEKAMSRLVKGGILFIFQDPIYYPSLTKFQLFFQKIAYFFWRIKQGNVIEGFKRRMKRNKGDFSDPMNDVEYHASRDGVNQNTIMNMLKQGGFNVEYYPYFSTQSSVFQWLGWRLGVKSNFGIIAKKA